VKTETTGSDRTLRAVAPMACLARPTSQASPLPTRRSDRCSPSAKGPASSASSARPLDRATSNSELTSASGSSSLCRGGSRTRCASSGSSSTHTNASLLPGSRPASSKGVALAEGMYPEPSWRVFGDVDVLVPADTFPRTVEILNDALVMRRDTPELRPGFDVSFGKEALLRTADGLEFDRHRTFVEGALGLAVHRPDLFASPRTFDVGGHRVVARGPAQQLLHAAYDAVVGDWPPRLSPYATARRWSWRWIPPPPRSSNSPIDGEPRPCSPGR
jgi:hypothetical protein